MKRSTLEILYCDVHARVRDLVRGRVLHVTCARNLETIISEGKILGNLKGRFKSPLGSSADTKFRSQNAVSLFDYRFSVPEEVVESFWDACNPCTALPGCRNRIALLFLKNDDLGGLMRATAGEGPAVQMVVPFVEAGYPSPLSLGAIEEIIEVHTRYYPSDYELTLDDSNPPDASTEQLIRAASLGTMHDRGWDAPEVLEVTASPVAADRYDIKLNREESWVSVEVGADDSYVEIYRLVERAVDEQKGE